MANKKNDFYWNNYISAADTACHAADYLLECLREFNIEQMNEILPKMHEFEHKGDSLRHEMTEMLAKSFPTVFQIIGAVFYFMVFPDDFTPDETFKRLMVAESYEEYQQNGSNYWSVIAEEIFDSLTSFGKVTGTVLGLGEEIGWRGFMYPELKNRQGRTKGLLIGGVIHGAWHFPIMILVGYEYGKDYIGAPVLGLFVFCMYTVSMGVISDFLK